MYILPGVTASILDNFIMDLDRFMTSPRLRPISYNLFNLQDIAAAAPINLQAIATAAPINLQAIATAAPINLQAIAATAPINNLLDVIQPHLVAEVIANVLFEELIDYVSTLIPRCSGFTPGKVDIELHTCESRLNTYPTVWA
jgi:hypothetical protein